eukprot:SAG22_NODE_1854_length_3438_cov_2.648697_2_plen_146_part_00
MASHRNSIFAQVAAQTPRIWRQHWFRDRRSAVTTAVPRTLAAAPNEASRVAEQTVLTSTCNLDHTGHSEQLLKPSEYIYIKRPMLVLIVARQTYSCTDSVRLSNRTMTLYVWPTAAARTESALWASTTAPGLASRSDEHCATVSS